MKSVDKFCYLVIFCQTLSLQTPVLLRIGQKLQRLVWKATTATAEEV